MKPATMSEERLNYAIAIEEAIAALKDKADGLLANGTEDRHHSYARELRKHAKTIAAHIDALNAERLRDGLGGGLREASIYADYSIVDAASKEYSKEALRCLPEDVSFNRVQTLFRLERAFEAGALWKERRVDAALSPPAQEAQAEGELIRRIEKLKDWPGYLDASARIETFDMILAALRAPRAVLSEHDIKALSMGADGLEDYAEHCENKDAPEMACDFNGWAKALRSLIAQGRRS